MTNALFRTIRQLSSSEEELLIYVRDSQPDDEFVHMLSSLSEVDYIILQTESLKNLCSAIHPHAVYLLERDHPVRLEEAKGLLESLIRQVV